MTADINKDEVLDDVVNFLRRALNLTAVSDVWVARLQVTSRFPSGLGEFQETNSAAAERI